MSDTRLLFDTRRKVVVIIPPQGYEYFLQAGVCRFCWTGDGTVDIFATTNEPSQAGDQQLLAKIRDCLSLDLNQEMLPAKLCESCSDQINVFHKFRKFCHESDRKLTELFKTYVLSASNESGEVNVASDSTNKQSNTETTKLADSEESTDINSTPKTISITSAAKKTATIHIKEEIFENTDDATDIGVDNTSKNDISIDGSIDENNINTEMDHAGNDGNKQPRTDILIKTNPGLMIEIDICKSEPNKLHDDENDSLSPYDSDISESDLMDPKKLENSGVTVKKVRLNDIEAKKFVYHKTQIPQVEVEKNNKVKPDKTQIPEVKVEKNNKIIPGQSSETEVPVLTKLENCGIKIQKVKTHKNEEIQIPETVTTAKNVMLFKKLPQSNTPLCIKLENAGIQIKRFKPNSAQAKKHKLGPNNSETDKQKHSTLDIPKKNMHLKLETAKVKTVNRNAVQIKIPPQNVSYPIANLQITRVQSLEKKYKFEPPQIIAELKQGIFDDHVCLGCGKRFESRNTRPRHEIICEGLINGNKCDLCRRILPCTMDIKRHMREHETNTLTLPELVFQCRQCEQQYDTSQKLRDHEKAVHPKKYICETCGQSFKKKTTLTRHYETHVEVGKYKCPHCHYHAKLPLNLKNHIRIHTGERPYLCDLCPHRCTTKSNLNTHRRMHLGQYRFECTMCERKFYYNKEYQQHVAYVHEKRPNMFTCAYCRGSYRTKCILKQHIATQHYREIGKEKLKRKW